MENWKFPKLILDKLDSACSVGIILEHCLKSLLTQVGDYCERGWGGHGGHSHEFCNNVPGTIVSLIHHSDHLQDSQSNQVDLHEKLKGFRLVLILSFILHQILIDYYVKKIWENIVQNN